MDEVKDRVLDEQTFAPCMRFLGPVKRGVTEKETLKALKVKQRKKRKKWMEWK